MKIAELLLLKIFPFILTQATNAGASGSIHLLLKISSLLDETLNQGSISI